VKLLLALLGHKCADPGPAVIRYSRATLCLECSMVTESTNDHCNFCAAPGCYLLNLASRDIRRLENTHVAERH
jgi:hypothetical protein